MMPVTMQRHDAPSRSGVTVWRQIAASRSYGRTDGLTETGGFRDEKIFRYVTRGRESQISRFAAIGGAS